MDNQLFRHFSVDSLLNVSFLVHVVELPLTTVLEVFGEYFLKYCLEHGYDKMLRTLGDNFETFIQNLDSLHALLAMSYKNMKAPSFRYNIIFKMLFGFCILRWS